MGVSELVPVEEDDHDCTVCGAMMEWVSCWHCLGEGGFHNCGDDCCPCAEPELDLNETCVECHGEGGYRQCPVLPHTDEQIAAKHQRDAESRK